MQKLANAILSFTLLGLLNAGGVFAQSLPSTPENADKLVLGVDTRVLELLENDVTRPVLEKHLPNLAKRLQEDFQAADYFWESTLRDLSIDDNHVRGFDEELLQKVAVALAAAQSKL